MNEVMVYEDEVDVGLLQAWEEAQRGGNGVIFALCRHSQIIIPSATYVKPIPFLKWAGGKRQLLGVMRKYRPSEFQNYHEICLGGGAHFFDLRASGYKGKAFLYDLNDELIRTYQAVQQDAQAVINEFTIHHACHCEPYYYSLRRIHPKNLSDIKVAGWLLYINKSSYNGLYRVNKQGYCNSPWGKRGIPTLNKYALDTVSLALRNTILIQGDFAVALLHVSDNDFALIDPPYPNSFKNYTSTGFPDTDQIRLRNVCVQLDRRNVMFMQTNADCPLIRGLYKDFKIIPVQARRNINCKGNGRGCVGEVLIMNY
ncbi:MAG: Dam family site-specific DNA-(adenine-N6)-methyltransferase [Kiritimatiellae bacterium]|nr:Dam family site-specific DNA-(adenine-N6)-methyltransferase [Kiritimatiellia bacterium]MDD5519476.1 Dam family site-specific DNA-(adenine-N6)-methyltransferase [Kiritimatiellia bacterium]